MSDAKVAWTLTTLFMGTMAVLSSRSEEALVGCTVWWFMVCAMIAIFVNDEE